MEGLEISEISFLDVMAQTNTMRIDPEYFNRDALKALQLIKGKLYLGDLVKDGYRVVYETTEAIDRQEGEKEGLPYFLQAADISTPFINAETMVCVSQADWERYPKGRIIPGELLIEVKGKAEKVALAPDDFPRNTLVTGTCFKLTTHDRIDQYMLAAYLTCRYGQILKDRLKSNLLISYLAKDDLYSLPVPSFSNELKTQLQSAFVACFECNKAANILLKEAETTLLRALNLENWQAPEPLSYIRNSREAFAAGRLDAEHFQPKYRNLIDTMTIKSVHYSMRPLGSLSEPLKYGCSDKMEYKESGRIFLRIADLDGKRFNHNTVLYVSQNNHFGESELVKKNDVLISRSGTLGIAVPIPASFSGAAYGSYFIRARPDKNIIHPEFLSLFVNSLAGKLQVEAKNTGGVQTNLTIPAIESLLIPVGDMDWQMPFVEIVKFSLLKRAQSAQLLEAAKRAVEIAIEDSETAALDFLRDAEK